MGVGGGLMLVGAPAQMEPKHAGGLEGGSQHCTEAASISLVVSAQSASNVLQPLTLYSIGAAGGSAGGGAGGSGGGGWARFPQSEQSVPKVQASYSAPGPATEWRTH